MDSSWSHFLSRVFLYTELHLGRETPNASTVRFLQIPSGIVFPNLGNQPKLGWSTAHPSLSQRSTVSMPPLLVSLFPSLRHLVQTWWDERHLHHIFSGVFCVFCLTSPISFYLWSLLCKLNSQLNISLLISCCCITLSSRQWIAGSWFHERPKSKRKYWRTISLYFKYYIMT